MLASRRSLVALLLLATWAAPLAAQDDDRWIGREFFDKAGAKFMLPSGEVPFSKITFPFTVSKVNGDWLWVGQAWIEKQHVVPVEDAPAYYTDYLRDNPASNWGYLSRGLAWKAKGELESAIRDYTEAIRIDPNDAYSYNNRGVVWEAKGELDYAIRDYTEAIRLDPNDAYSYINRGVVWKAKGELDNAIRDYTEAIRLDPKDAAAYNGRAWLRATCGEARYRDGAQAVADATKACELTEWQKYSYLDTLAAAYAESGDFDKAIHWQTKAIDLAPDGRKDDYRSRLEMYRAG